MYYTDMEIDGLLRYARLHINSNLLSSHFHEVAEGMNFTSSTSASYTGLSITIPAKSFYSLCAYVSWGSCQPSEIYVSMSQETHTGAPNASGVVAYNTAQTSWSGYRSTETTFYIWAKYSSAGTNYVGLNGFYVTV